MRVRGNLSAGRKRGRKVFVLGISENTQDFAHNLSCVVCTVFGRSPSQPRPHPLTARSGSSGPIPVPPSWSGVGSAEHQHALAQPQDRVEWPGISELAPNSLTGPFDLDGLRLMLHHVVLTSVRSAHSPCVLPVVALPGILVLSVCCSSALSLRKVGFSENSL